MNDPAVKVTLDVTANSEEVVERYCIDFLKDRGFNVTAPHEKWESVAEFKDRLGVCYETVLRKSRPWPGRPNVVLQKGAKGRVIAILSNPIFDSYVTAGKQPRNA